MKNIYEMLFKFFGVIVAVTLPIHPALIAVAVLLSADMITGLWASLKEKKPITSSGLRRTVIKMLGYQLAIVTAFVLETYLLDGMPVVKVVTGLIGVTEGKSLFENITRVTGIDFSSILSKLNLPDIKTPDDKK